MELPYLTVEWNVILILLQENFCQQTGTRKSLINRQQWKIGYYDTTLMFLGKAVLSFSPYLGRMISFTYNLSGSNSSVRVRYSPIRLYFVRSRSCGSMTTSTTGSPSSSLRFCRSFFLVTIGVVVCPTTVSSKGFGSKDWPAVQTEIADLGPDGITFHSYDQKVVGSTTLPETGVHPVCFVTVHSVGSAL